ncbi:MAG: sugar ABC transporter substrate-binding protein, partial [Clostridia bacterium]|nr:sugar ABC transporter substrate-binding protein [Clostridia bacterium]
VPNIPTTRAFYYNKDLFDAAGVPYPTDDWTWDDFVEIAIKLTDKDQNQFGFVTEYDNPYTVQQFVWTNGGDFIGEDGVTVDGYVNSPATVEAVQWYADLVSKHKVSPTPSSSTTMGGATEIFKTGKAAMIESGMWQLNTFKEIFNVGTVMSPTKDGNRVGVMHTSGLCVSVDTKYPEEAVRFATYFGGKPGQTEFVKLGYGLAEMPSIAEELGTAEDEYMKAFYDMIPYCTVKPCFFRAPDWELINEKLAFAIDLAQTGEVTAQQALDEAVVMIEQSLLVGR